jgi:hypothetical protein
MSKARNLSDFISDPTISTTEIADLAVTHAKLHGTMDLSSKTVTLPTLSTLNTTGNVGIGTSSPDMNLHVTGGEVLFESTGNSKLQIKAGNTSGSFIEFADAQDGNVGRLFYDHSDNHMQFTVNAAERMRINSSGRQSYNGTAYAIAHGNFVGEVASSGYRALSFEHTVGGGEVGSIRTTSSTAVYYGDGSQLTGVGSPSIVDNGNATAMSIDSSENIDINNSVVVGANITAQQSRINDGTSLAGGMFVEKDVTGSGSSNDLTIFADGITNGGNIHLMTGGTADERLTVDASGRVTKPFQPYFYVRAPGTQYVTAGGYVGFTWNSEVKDVGGNFASNVFTAPVTGVYSLTLNVRYDSVKDGASYYNTTIATSNRSHAQLFSPQGFDRNVDYWVFTMNVIADMDAGDTASCNVGQIGGSSGTSINQSTAFYGYLLG